VPRKTKSIEQLLEELRLFDEDEIFLTPREEAERAEERGFILIELYKNGWRKTK
jgi:hypothetical protein